MLVAAAADGVVAVFDFDDDAAVVGVVVDAAAVVAVAVSVAQANVWSLLANTVASAPEMASNDSPRHHIPA